MLIRDSEKATDPAPFTAWHAAWKRLTEGKGGVPTYPPHLLLEEVLWAYENKRRASSSTGSGVGANAPSSRRDEVEDDE